MTRRHEVFWGGRFEVVELRQITKTYRENGVHALSGVDFLLVAGELHTVAGENGAGKSTLMHVLGGFVRPDSGKILLDGKPQHFPVPAAALRAGIGMVRQRPALVDDFSVWENCALGGAGNGFLFNRKKARDTVSALAAKLGFRLPLDAKAGELTLAGQKKAAVLSLVMHGASFFIFDEPLAYLGRDEKDEMLELFCSLRNEGKGVAVIAHEIAEILPVSNRVTVLRNGRVVLTGEQHALDEAQVVEAMFGKPADTTALRKKNAGAQADSDVVLSVNNLRVSHPAFYPLEQINLEVRRGEIVGVAGARESGVETLERTLAGFIQPAGGSISVRPATGRAVPQSGNCAYIGLGSNTGAFAPSLSVRDNLILHEHRKRALLDRKALADFAASLVAKAGLTVPAAAPASSLSGGMLARIIAERELAKGAEVLLLSDPSAGLDLQALNALLLKIRAFADGGGAALFFLGGVPANDPGGTPELAEICDRVYYIANGRLLPDNRATGGINGAGGINDAVSAIGNVKTAAPKEPRRV